MPIVEQPSDASTARAAIERGRLALASGDGAQATAWLGRAARLTSNDPTVELLRASILLGHDPLACAAILARLLERHPGFREARIMLMVCDLRLSRPSNARIALEFLLANHTPPETKTFRGLADLIAFEAGGLGWMGMAPDGTATLSRREGLGGRHLTLLLDGKPVATRRVAGTGPTRVKLPRDWRERQTLTATFGGAPLLGSPLHLAPFIVTQGVAGVQADGSITGWAWHPADPDRDVTLRLAIRDRVTGRLTTSELVAADDAVSGATKEFERHRVFSIPASGLPSSGEVSLTGLDGTELSGSPIPLGREAAASRAAVARFERAYALRVPAGEAPETRDMWRPLDCDLLSARSPSRNEPRPMPRRVPLDIVIPVFHGASDFIHCLETLAEGLPFGTRLVVVDDGSRDRLLREALAGAETAGSITLLRHPRNQGFPAAANTGLKFSAANEPRDVLLLNCDTLMPPGAASRLAQAAYAAADIGSITPLTNDGTILSYPRIDGDNDVPDLSQTIRLDHACQAANQDALIDIPTAVGFCMYMRHDCLAEVGGFRADVFAQGYGEENDWCLRASHLGWRHVAAAGVFVGHVGGQSFGAVKPYLIARNMRMLNGLHPGYDRLIADFVARDALAPSRRAVDIARWREQRNAGGAVLLVTHDRGGGVGLHVRTRCAAIRNEGLRPIVIRPKSTALSCAVMGEDEDEFPNLVFTIPTELDDLATLLSEDGPLWVELHHSIGQPAEIPRLAHRLGIPLDIYIHDYAMWCPRVTLVSYGDRYCGEPTRIEDCIACVADLGERIHDTIGVADLRQRSASLLREARAVIAPSQDAARRIRRHFPFANPTVRPWEQDITGTAEPPSFSATGRARIVIPGAIGSDKGYDVVLACARDAARRDLPIEFVIVGHTLDDGRMLATNRVFVTGRYEEHEGPALVRAQNASFGFVPSIWPETWCYALSLLWRAGLRAAAFEIGAQAERIGLANAGVLLPLGLPAGRINDQFVKMLPARP